MTNADKTATTVATPTATRWTDRERVLALCSRGCVARTRHLLNDLRRLMPHIRHESKFEKGQRLEQLNEMAELSNCTKCLYLENRKHHDLYMWLAATGAAAGGPSVKFLVHNMHTMFELKYSGNCLKGSRPILSFDPAFNTQPHLKLIKELLVGVFKTPANHPKSQPFIDHVLNFALTADGNIWLRNYQILDKTGKLEEIGPRMVLEVIRIFDGAFGGAVLYDNPDYRTPNAIRRERKLTQAAGFARRQADKEAGRIKEAFVKSVPNEDPVGSVFDTEGLDEKKEKESKAVKAIEKKILGKRKIGGKSPKAKAVKKAKKLTMPELVNEESDGE